MGLSDLGGHAGANQGGLFLSERLGGLSRTTSGSEDLGDLRLVDMSHIRYSCQLDPVQDRLIDDEVVLVGLVQIDELVQLLDQRRVVLGSLDVEIWDDLFPLILRPFCAGRPFDDRLQVKRQVSFARSKLDVQKS